MDKVDIFKRYHIDTLYDKNTRDELQKVKLLVILQERKDLLSKELNTILNNYGITILYYSIYVNIKIDDITTYVEQQKKDNEFQNAMNYKKILDDFINQYKIYELEYSCPDIIRELNLFQKKEYLLKELQKYQNTIINDSKMKKNCNKFISEIKNMSLLSLDNISSPSKVKVNINNTDINNINNNDINNTDININKTMIDIQKSDEVIVTNIITSPTPPSSQPPSFVSPKKQSQTQNKKTNDNDNDIVTEDIIDENIDVINENTEEYINDIVVGDNNNNNNDDDEDEVRKPEEVN